MSRVKANSGKAGTHTSIIKKSMEFNSTASSIGAVVDQMQIQLDKLSKEIQADRDGITMYEAELQKLSVQAAEVANRLERNRTWSAEYDKKLKPFEKTYAGLAGDIRQLYSAAADKHEKGVKVLKQEFNYNPSYKKHGDTFTAIPFKPRPG